MQQPASMMPVTPSYPPANITTEQIQKYLEENKKLILAILENQNLGKLAECAQYQAQLQKNLMYLAAIADAQPQVPAMPPQMGAPHPAMQQGAAFYMHPQAAQAQAQAQAQAAAMAQQPPGMFSPRMQMQFSSPHQLHEQQQQHLHQQSQQMMQGQMNMRPGGPGNGMHPMHSEPGLGGGSTGGSGPNKQDAPETGHSSDAPGGHGDPDPSS